MASVAETGHFADEVHLTGLEMTSQLGCRIIPYAQFCSWKASQLGCHSIYYTQFCLCYELRLLWNQFNYTILQFNNKSYLVSRLKRNYLLSGEIWTEWFPRFLQVVHKMWEQFPKLANREFHKFYILFSDLISITGYNFEFRYIKIYLHYSVHSGCAAHLVSYSKVLTGSSSRR
jgi:hypothetical protein